ncbi:hAT family C-terminal dimerization region [Phytophthora infestans]|uniref:HAT family C-terminal dimerization region n=1 Tax=Phytophthora infestans TaxID=4787 RepID=A0A833S4J0_PHYIN|nr:hAT family C-terminal dimerization region [Phytophthora infestans]
MVSVLDLLKFCTESEVVSEDGSPDKVIPPDSPSLIAVKKLILAHGMPKWKLVDKHYVAAILDPRQKRKLRLYGVDELQVTNARNILLALMRASSTRICVDEPVPVSAAPTKRKKQRRGFISLNAPDELDEAEKTTDPPTKRPEEIEMDRYGALRLSETEAKAANPGRDGELPSFPLLGHVARSALEIPASSAMSESNFSDAGNAFGIKRAMLSPSVLDDILVARSNADLL